MKSIDHHWSSDQTCNYIIIALSYLDIGGPIWTNHDQFGYKLDGELCTVHNDFSYEITRFDT